jgi:hypothetical protein
MSPPPDRPTSSSGASAFDDDDGSELDVVVHRAESPKSWDSDESLGSLQGPEDELTGSTPRALEDGAKPRKCRRKRTIWGLCCGIWLALL